MRAVLDIIGRPILLSGRVVTLVKQCVERFKDKGLVLLFNRVTHFHPPNPRLLFRNAVLFFEARFETFQIYWNPRLRTFRSRPKILHGPCDGWSSSRAARNAQCGSRKNSRAIITASACSVRIMCSA